MNKLCTLFVASAVAATAAMAHAKETVPDVPPYPLPVEAQRALSTLAAKCDVLILGEMHGTKEMPALVAALLEPLTQLGYRAIALEVPRDEQTAIEAWAAGKTEIVPKFFANPGSDGRGNREVLAMLRQALRPPFEWKLVCFDQTEAEMSRLLIEHFPKDANATIAELAANLSMKDLATLGRQRDESMADYFAASRGKLPPNTKIVALCGNLHARTANRATESNPMAAFWPSFAANLAEDSPKLSVRSVNVVPFSGEYFNGGQVNRFAPRPLENVEARPTPNSDWDWELNLPQASAATFLKPPAN